MKDYDALFVTSGPGARQLYQDKTWLSNLKLDPQRQIIAAIDSGALILAALGLLNGLTATTYPTAKILLENMGISYIEQSFVEHNNIATAAACLASADLSYWIIKKLLDQKIADEIMLTVKPLGYAS